MNKLFELTEIFYKLATGDEDKVPDSVLLPPNKNQKENLIDLKNNLLVDMSPELFLEMTTSDIKGKFEIFDRAKPLEFYKSEEIQQGMSVHPFLRVNIETGKITGHEGRHRAAAVWKAGGKWVRVGISLRPDSRNHRPDKMPGIWIGQFNSEKFNIKQLIENGKMRIVNDSVQKKYWRE